METSQEDDHGNMVDKVEEAIRRAEELMSKDLEMLKRRSDGSDNDDDEQLEIHESNRYRDPEAREMLIAKLLKEREESVQTNMEMERLSEKVVSRSRNNAQQADGEEMLQENQTQKSNNKKKKQSTKAGSSIHKVYKKGDDEDQQAPSRAMKNAFRRKSLDQVKRQVELERSKDCTFKPKIREYPKVKPESIDERLDRLARPKSEYYMKQAQTKEELEKEELNKSCPFKPDIGLTKQVYDSEDVVNNNNKSNKDTFESGWQRRVKEAYRNHVPVEKRLHLDAKQRWEARDRAKRELEEAELQAQPFRPKVNHVSEEIAKQIDYEPIEKRAARVQREKLERLAKKKLEYELNHKDLTFRPKISESSERIAQSASLRKGVDPHQDVVNRLLNKSNDIQERRRSRQQAWAEQQDSECQFKPKVSENSQKLLSRNPAYQRSVDFLTRQQVLEEERKLREQRRRAEVHDMSGVATFKPKVGNSERILLTSRPERLTENTEQRFERLYKRDKERKDLIQDQIREQFYGQFDFKPRINHISEEIVRETHKRGEELYEDLYRNERSKHYREVAQTQVEEECLKDCTFRPQTLARRNAQASDAIRYARKGSDQTIRIIEEKRREKERKLQEMRKENEYEELKACTFTPEVNESLPKQANGPVVVRGLGRFLELRELHKKQTEDQRAREAKVFLEDTNALRIEPYTVPEPFKLSSSNFSQLSARDRYTGEVEYHKDKYTFKPKTMVQEKRKQVHQILKSR